jgi:type IV pilus assembly protein PilQ
MNMTKLRNVLLVAFFALSSLCAPAFAQRITNDRFPNDARFDQILEVQIPSTGMDLSQYLREIASLVKLQAITEGIPAKNVSYSFKAIPFRQFWSMVVSLNNLDYELLPNDVVVVGPPEVVQKFRPPAPVQTVTPTNTTPAAVLVVKTYEIKSNAENIAKALSAQFTDVKIVPVAGTNKLVITATQNQHTDIAALLVQIDIASAAVVVDSSRIVQQIYVVSYGKASRLAEILKQLVAGPSITTTPTTTTTTGVAAPNATSIQAMPNINIVADDGSNTLIIRGPETSVAGLIALLPNLDKPRQLVNIGVRVQENTESGTRSLGIDWKNIGLGNFSGSILGGALNFVADATNSLAGLNLTAALTALETQGLSRQINDSTLSVLNNGTASVRTGGRIELSIPSSGQGGPPIDKTLTFGIKVDVSPTIAADDSITLDVNAEVSSVQNATNPNPNRIDFTDNTAKSVVRLKSGQTLLLASLLATSQDSTTSGVPILSAIPLIGDLFKTTRTSDTQKQLLIVITADIIK